jgi:hypothetical protein
MIQLVGSLACFALGFAAYVTCFVLGIQTKKLGTFEIVMGTAGMCCGIGAITFLGMSFRAVQQQAFDIAADGGDIASARTKVTLFKVAAAVAVIAFIVGAILVNTMGNLGES